MRLVRLTPVGQTGELPVSLPRPGILKGTPLERLNGVLVGSIGYVSNPIFRCVTVCLCHRSGANSCRSGNCTLALGWLTDDMDVLHRVSIWVKKKSSISFQSRLRMIGSDIQNCLYGNHCNCVHWFHLKYRFNTDTDAGFGNITVWYCTDLTPFHVHLETTFKLLLPVTYMNDHINLGSLLNNTV